ncbi:MAG: GTPase HflX [Anaerolineae bacterium]
MADQQQYREITEAVERGYLVGVYLKGSHPLLSIQDSLDELASLAATAGVEVVGRTVQQLERPHPATFIGPGKVAEVQEELAASGANVVIFDDELSPRHQRELEKAFGEDIKVLDRSALILDIFARHAQTREGALQVELAQYEYRLPRLTRQWTHLARQTGGGAARAGAGGVGLRGPGETQLEVDRREISRRIARLKKELEAVRAHRSRYRAQRKMAGIPVVALVGYTNAGKSTLLNTLAGADVYTADQLFATLDPTTRRVTLPGGKTFLCSDTVGFIQKLPTTLIAAFRATLEEVAEATMLLHVADISHPNVVQQIESVEDTLAALELPRMPRLLALNKIDLLGDETLRGVLSHIRTTGYEAVIPVSAKTGAGLARLLTEIEGVLAGRMRFIHVLIPYNRGDVIARIHEQGLVLDEQHTGEGVIVQAQVPADLAAQIVALEAVANFSG